MKNDNTTNLGLALLRIVPSAFLIANHGFGRLMKLVNGNTEFADHVGVGPARTLFLAVLAEVLCPLLIILGFQPRRNARPRALTMFVAAFVFHGAGPFGRKELPLLFLVVFATLF